MSEKWSVGVYIASIFVFISKFWQILKRRFENVYMYNVLNDMLIFLYAWPITVLNVSFLPETRKKLILCYCQMLNGTNSVTGTILSVSLFCKFKRSSGGSGAWTFLMIHVHCFSFGLFFVPIMHTVETCVLESLWLVPFSLFVKINYSVGVTLVRSRLYYIVVVGTCILSVHDLKAELFLRLHHHVTGC